jgi:hypothetical protein
MAEFDDVDNDTLAAVQAVWASDTTLLPTLVAQPPRVMRLKKGIVPPGFSDGKLGYVGLDCVLDHRELAGTAGGWFDVRKVTMRAWGVKGIAQQIGQGMWTLFNRKTVLTLPSTDPVTGMPRFHKWWPEGGVDLKEDPEVKTAQDIWYAELVAKVWSIRQE